MFPNCFIGRELILVKVAVLANSDINNFRKAENDRDWSINKEYRKISACSENCSNGKSITSQMVHDTNIPIGLQYLSTWDYVYIISRIYMYIYIYIYMYIYIYIYSPSLQHPCRLFYFGNANDHRMKMAWALPFATFSFFSIFTGAKHLKNWLHPLYYHKIMRKWDKNYNAILCVDIYNVYIHHSCAHSMLYLLYT